MSPLSLVANRARPMPGCGCALCPGPRLWVAATVLGEAGAGLPGKVPYDPFQLCDFVWDYVFSILASDSAIFNIGNSRNMSIYILSQ